MYACWSVKGGSGTTVFAAALSLSLAEKREKATVIDFGGDMPSVLGMAEPAGRGIRDWLADPLRSDDSLQRLRLDATSRLAIVPAGSITTFDADALVELGHSVDDDTVVDFGLLQPPDSLRDSVNVDWLVIRPCYLSLRRAARLARRPHAVVVIRESGRALTTRDIESVVGAPVIADITVSEAVARSVDAGLLATRLPRQLASEVAALV
jgi:hypothetical protein